MDTMSRPAKLTPKSQRTRARILESAMRLFADVGYHAATNSMIADAAKRLKPGGILLTGTNAMPGWSAKHCW